MLIHFHFGKFLHHPYVLLLGEVMPNFFIEQACLCMCVCMLWLILINILYMYTAQATMVMTMSSGQISRYKEEATTEMIRCNRRHIRCPCQKCKLVSWIDPDSGQLEDHLLRHGFMLGFNQAPTTNVDEGGKMIMTKDMSAGKMIMTKDMPAGKMIMM